MLIAVEAMILIINTHARTREGFSSPSSSPLLSPSLSLFSHLFCFCISRAFSHLVPSFASQRIADETATPLMARVQWQEYRFNELWDVP